MANTSEEHPCRQLLDHCLRGEAWPAELLDRAIEEDDGRALLSIVVERLGDLFEPRLCQVYRRLFAEVIERVAPELRERIRGPEIAHRAPIASQLQTKRVYVLSRVTLGADVAVTSVLMDAAKRRFPDAEIIFVGPRKSYEMFEADPRIDHSDAPYARTGSLAERLRASAELWIDDGIVIDPDSRLTQLGLISVGPVDRYFHFESRAFGGETQERLPALASHWAREMLGVENARAFVAPLPAEGEPADITMSLGVGENPAKRIGGDFEIDLLGILSASGKSILIDKGGSDEERDRVERLVDQSRISNVQTHDGSFAHFAAEIARSKLYAGYDSAGGHVASACGVPVISVFAGAVSDRFAARWSPTGTVIRADNSTHRDVINEVRHATAKTVEI